MKSYTKQTLLQLQKSLSEIEWELETAAPELYAEMRLIERLIDARRHGEPGMFDKTRKISEALTLCFTEAGTWLTVDEILEMLAGGGYPLQPGKARQLVQTNLAYHQERGKFTKITGKWGLSFWEKPTQSK